MYIYIYICICIYIKIYTYEYIYWGSGPREVPARCGRKRSVLCSRASPPCLLPPPEPPWRQHWGKWHLPKVDPPLHYHLNQTAFWGSVYFWEAPFALMLSPGWLRPLGWGSGPREGQAPSSCSHPNSAFSLYPNSGRNGLGIGTSRRPGSMRTGNVSSVQQSGSTMFSYNCSPIKPAVKLVTEICTGLQLNRRFSV